MRFLGNGSVGGILAGFNNDSFFCLKLVKRSSDKIDFFWNAAKGIAAWTAYVRFNSSCHKVPVAQQYWIKDDKYSSEPRLSSVIHNHNGPLGDCENCPPDLRDVHPDRYFLCPRDVLEQIFADDMDGNIKRLDLLITYPVQKGGKSLYNYIDEKTEFSERELLDCCYQILSVIYGLFKQGTAHRDIKPANILVEENYNRRKIFKLIDYDGFTSPEHRNILATRYFEPDELIQEKILIKHEYSYQNFFTQLDCFALSQTLLCMAARKNDPVKCRLPETFPKILRQLRKIESFSPEKIKPFLTRLEKEYGLQKPELVYIPTHSHNVYRFEDLDYSLSSGWVYGTFFEQIRFSEKFDPLLKIKGCQYWNNELSKISDIILIPLLTDRYSTFFHAPDDAATQKRAASFDNYKPKDLTSYSLTEEEKETLFQYGKRLNSFFQEHGSARFILPEHIVWVDGEIRILYVGIQAAPYDAEKCFRHFCGDKTAFDSEYWQNFLEKAASAEGRGFEPFLKFSEFKEYVFSRAKAEKLSSDEMLFLLNIFPELENHLKKKLCRSLLEKFKGNSGYAWIFNYENFRKNVKTEDFSFSCDHWYKLRYCTTEFDSRIPPETAYEIYKKSSAEEQKELLSSPELASKIQDFINRDPKELFKSFFRNKKFDEKTFLKTFPEDVRQLFNGKAWGKIFAVNAELLKFMPNEIFSDLDKKGWVNLLIKYPELIKKCDRVSSFSKENWRSMLLNQPSLKKYCPENIVFSEDEQKKLNSSSKS